jgi:hypothetical protein
MKSFVEIDAREAATVLAALRAWQDRYAMSNINYFEVYAPLENTEIDALCERINIDGIE